MTELTTEGIREAIERIEYFVSIRGKGAVIKPEKPLGRWLENLQRLGEGKPLVAPPEAPEDQQKLFSIADVCHAYSLAWSIQVLEPRAWGRDYVAKSLVTDELLGSDDHDAALPGMPGGFGTIYLGARCVHCGGGAVKLEGRKSRGVDITWWPRGSRDQSVTIVFERKDFAFDRSAHRDAGLTATRISDRLKESSEKLPAKREGLTRVSIVGVTCEYDTARSLQGGILKMNPGAAKASGLEIPDLAVVYCTGIGTSAACCKVDDFPNIITINQDIDETDPAMQAIKKAFAPTDT